MSEAQAAEATPAAPPAAPATPDPTELPAPPPKAAPTEADLVQKVATSVIQTLQAAQPKPAKKEPDPLKGYFEEDTRGFLKSYGEVVKEETKKEMRQQLAAERAFDAAYNEAAAQYEGINTIPEIVESEIYRVQAEYKAKHNADLPAHEALKPAMARAAKRVPGQVKERSAEDISNAQLPGSGGGYAPQKQFKMTSTEDWVKQQQQVMKQFKVKKG